MSSVDRHARKQVLLARIAYSRGELRRDVAQVKHAVQLPQLMRAVVGDSLGGALSRALFGGNGVHSAGEWLGTAMAWLSRYRVAASLLGGLAPFLKGRGVHRLLRLVAVGTAGWLGWRTFTSRRRQP